MKVDIKAIKPNTDNPRVIKDEKFNKLVKSIKEFPEMLELRPIVVDGDMVVLGGNMRLKACIAAGLTQVPVLVADTLTEEQKAEFIIKDNVGFGEWDWDILANQWDNEALADWGLDVWVPENDINLDDFFKEEAKEDKEQPDVIVLKYSQEEHDIVKAKLLDIAATPEQAVWQLLGLKE